MQDVLCGLKKPPISGGQSVWGRDDPWKIRTVSGREEISGAYLWDRPVKTKKRRSLHNKASGANLNV